MDSLSFAAARGRLVAAAINLTTGELAVRLALLGDHRSVDGCSRKSLASRLAWLLLPPDYVNLELSPQSSAVQNTTLRTTGGF